MNQAAQLKMGGAEAPGTQDRRYSVELLSKQLPLWKRALDVQAPYRWNLRRLRPGFTLDVGCGLGRNLIHLGGHGIGLDHNAYSIDLTRARGLRAFTPDDFESSVFCRPDTFDSILLSHVAEHMTEPDAVNLLGPLLPLLKPGGQVILIAPQELGYRSDPTHVQFLDFSHLRRIISFLGLALTAEYSFPFPRSFGRFFKYNEFVSVGRKPLACSQQ